MNFKYSVTRSTLRTAGLMFSALVLASCSGDEKNDNTVTTEGGVEPSLVEGQVFIDSNNNDQLDANESPRVGIKVYADLNDNGLLDEGEAMALTDDSGQYTLNIQSTGPVKIRQELGFGWRNSLAGQDDQAEALVLPSPEASTNSAEYPFSTLLFSQDEDGFLLGSCSGVLISDKWGITAGHCLDIIDGAPIQDVFVGVEAAAAPGAEESRVAISRIIQHPDFQSLEIPPDQSKDEFFASFGDDLSPTEIIADIAVFELAQPIDLETSGLATIRLADTVPSETTLATTPAYGLTSFGSDFGFLTEDHLPIQGATFCDADVEPRPFNADTQICGGYEEGGFSGCPGDSGAPLIVKDASETTWLLAGITSYGPSCGVGFDVPENTPSYFMSIPFYKSWVEENATESSVVLSLELESGGVYSENNFANVSTLNEFTSPVVLKDRYQLTTASATVGDNNSLQIDAIIRDENTAGRNFQCELSLLPDNVINYTFDCAASEHTEIINTIDSGIYLPSLTVALNADDPDVVFRNLTPSYITIGDVEESVVNGALTEDDSTDLVVFTDNFFDAYELSIASFPGFIAVAAVSDDIGLDLFVIDRDIYEASGGDLSAAVVTTNFSSGAPELNFLPEDGVNYAVIVRAFNAGDVGEYQLILRNGASAIAIDAFNFANQP